MSVSMVARRSTTVSIVPFTTSSESWVRCSTVAWACFNAATSWLSASNGPAGGGAAGARIGAQPFEVIQQLGHAALDRREVTEPAFRGVELFHQPGDAVLETAERQLIAARQLLARRLNALYFVVGRLHQMIQIGRHVAGVLGADRLDGVGDRPDPHLQRPEDIRTAGRRHPLLDPVAAGAHLTGERRQRIAGRDLPDNAAQGLDRGLEPRQARATPPARPNAC